MRCNIRVKKERKSVSTVTYIIAVIIGVLIIILLTLTIQMNQKGKRYQGAMPFVTPTPEQELSEEEVTISHALLKGKSTQEKIFSVMNLKDGIESKLTYTSETKFVNRYKETVMPQDIEIGEVITVTYGKKTGKIKSCSVDLESWEKKKVTNWSLDKKRKRMNVGQTEYAYNDQLAVIANEQKVDLLKLHEKDILTVRGIGEQVYSIVVTTGHGYLKLVNYEAFVGGNIEVGYDVMTPITEDMLLVVREGDYKVTLENGELESIKYIHINANEDTMLDMSEYVKQEKQQGEVEFVITPTGADLYIENVITDYENPISLEYGSYQIRVELTGYQTYTGTLTVAQKQQAINIRLVSQDTTKPGTPTEEPNVIIDDTDPAEEEVDSSESQETSSPTISPTETVDENTDIKVTTPVGAELYFNNTYKGTIPVSFPKEVGTHTITLKKEGYETKNYTIEVTDDNKEAIFSFPDMVQK